MMVVRSWAFGVALITSMMMGCATGQAEEATADAAGTNAAPVVQLVPNDTEYTTLTNVTGNGEYDFGFQVGEELYYKIYWGWIPVGKSRIITRWVEKDGKRFISIRFRTRSNSVIRKIYKVDDRFESIIDPETFLPVKFSKKLHEGKQRYHQATTFDHVNKVAIWKSFKKNEEKVLDIESDTRDILTSLYYMRSMKIEEGDHNAFTVMEGEKLYELEVQAHKVERVRTKGFGKVKALKLVPKAKFNGLFVQKGKMTTWGSTDERFVAVRIEGQIPVAKVKIILSEVYGPKEDFWTKKTKKNSKSRAKKEVDEEEVEAALRELD
ncbi:MAG: DUF3108 domain-containing protein [Kiritimatiellae bacterium]|nr:DUF3108 domain-containing protein [Kiritimatiellia bacterium]